MRAEPFAPREVLQRLGPRGKARGHRRGHGRVPVVPRGGVREARGVMSAQWEQKKAILERTGMRVVEERK